MKVITKVVAVLLLASSASAMAAGVGGFAFADLGQSSYSGAQNPVAVRLGGGYNFTEIKNAGVTIGAEGAFALFGKSSYSLIGQTYTTKTNGLMANAVVDWQIPHVRGLSVVGKLGVLHAMTSASFVSVNPFTGQASGISTSGTSNGLFFGAGVRYDFNDHLGVRAMYEDFGSAVTGTTGATYGLTMLSAGVIYSF